MVSFHPPRFDSRCSQILFHWLERLLQQQKKADTYKTIIICTSQWHKILQIDTGQCIPGGSRVERNKTDSACITSGDSGRNFFKTKKKDTYKKKLYKTNTQQNLYLSASQLFDSGFKKKKGETFLISKATVQLQNYLTERKALSTVAVHHCHHQCHLPSAERELTWYRQMDSCSTRAD